MMRHRVRRAAALVSRHYCSVTTALTAVKQQANEGHFLQMISLSPFC
jgi:hypothetical protein